MPHLQTECASILVCISIEHEDEAKATRPMMNIVDVWRLKYDTVPSSLSVADAPGTKIRLDRSCANLGLGRAPLRGPEAKEWDSASTTSRGREGLPLYSHLPHLCSI